MRNSRGGDQYLGVEIILGKTSNHKTINVVQKLANYVELWTKIKFPGMNAKAFSASAMLVVRDMMNSSMNYTWYVHT